MSISEIEDRLYYKRLQDKIETLDHAFYIGCFVMNQKMEDTYKAIKKEILGHDGIEVDKNKFKRFKMISKRLGVEYPGERVE